MQIMTINEFANRCGYFFNAGTDPEALCAPNNGYNCNHPEQTEKQNGVGCCFQWSCPLAIPADEEDCEKYGIEYEEKRMKAGCRCLNCMSHRKVRDKDEDTSLRCLPRRSK